MMLVGFNWMFLTVLGAEFRCGYIAASASLERELSATV